MIFLCIIVWFVIDFNYFYNYNILKQIEDFMASPISVIPSTPSPIPPSPSPKLNKLTVEWIQPSEYPHFQQLCKSWMEIATSKSQREEGKFESVTLAQCSETSGFLADFFGQPLSPLNAGFEACVCKDSLGSAQGLALLKDTKQTLRIELPVTNPINIRAKCNETEAGRVLGVGGSLIEFASSHGIALNKTALLVESTPHAKTFYAKFGFIEKCKVQCGDEIIMEKPLIANSKSTI